MTVPGPLTRALLAVADRRHPDDQSLAARICDACTAADRFDGASVSVLTASDARAVLCVSGPMAELVEDLQHTVNEGPGIEAAVTGRPVLVTDLHRPADTARWPAFASAAAEQTAVRAVLAYPLRWGVVDLGVLSLLSHAPMTISDERWRDLAAAADTAALMLLTQRTAPDDPSGRQSRLDLVVWQHPEIHQATGMVMVQLGVVADDALARLRGHAFATCRLLVDVARDVIERRLDFPRDAP